jgi:hypothetical protein
MKWMNTRFNVIQKQSLLFVIIIWKVKLNNCILPRDNSNICFKVKSIFQSFHFAIKKGKIDKTTHNNIT